MNANKEPEGTEYTWWTTEEVAKVLKVSTFTLREMAKELGLLDFRKGTRTKWSMTDVRMVKRAMERKKEGKKRDHRAAAIRLAICLEKEERKT